MAKPVAVQNTMTAAECARRTGLTIKALRLYEREGLLQPLRTAKDWRIYSADDLVRLGEVIALRALGFKLSEIGRLLKGKIANIGQMLELQQDELLRKRLQIDAALAIIAKMRGRAASGESLSILDLANIIKESQMTVQPTETTAWKRYEQMRPRIATALALGDMQAYCGYFLLEDNQPMHVFIEDKKLMAQLPGQPALQIFQEAPDHFFYTDVVAQISFQRQADGAVSSMTLHQEGLDHTATRVSEAEANARISKLAARVKSGQPHENSQHLAEMILDGQIAGKPRLDLMAAPLAALALEQSERVAKELQQLGKRTSVSFLAVTPEGSDCFRVNFEKGELDMSVFVDANGKVSGALIQPAKTESFWEQVRASVS